MRTIGAVVMVLAAACSTSSKKQIEVGPALEHVAINADGQRATFAASGSPAIATQAMVYPAQALVEPAPPMSLTASDGTGLALVALDARAVIDGPLAFTELAMTFENPRDQVIEGRFAITLPTDAAVSRLAMKIDGRWQEAEMVELQKARRAYEDFLHRRQDPALLEKAAGNEFRARIFPIPARGTKEIVLSYSHELTSSEDSYRLPLRGLPQIRSLSIHALRGSAAPGAAVAYRATDFTRSNYKPDRDFEIAQAGTVRALAAGDLAVVRVAPTLDNATAGIRRARILFDTSASRAPGFRGQVETLGALITALADAHHGLVIEVAAFDNGVELIYSGPAASFGHDQLDALRLRRPLGASNLHGALQWAAGRPAHERLIVVTDAVATAGPTEAGELTAVARGIPELSRVDVILNGGIRDDAMALALARDVASSDGIVADGGTPVAALAMRLGRTTVSGIEVSVPGAALVWPRTLDGLQPGDERLVFVQMKRPITGALDVELSGAIQQRQSIAVVHAQRPLVERALARAEISALTAERDALPASDKARRDSLKQRIVTRSVAQRVMSDFTALLVLETEDDYRRFAIDRKSLTDILTVGPDGVRATSRSDIVMIAIPKPATTGFKGKPEKKKADDGKDTGVEGLVSKKPADVDLLADPKPDPGAVRDDDDDDDEAYDFGDDKAEEEKVGGESTGRMGTAGRGHSGAPSAPSPPPPPAAEPMADEPAPVERPGPMRLRGETDNRTVEQETGPPPLTGKLAAIMATIAAGDAERAVVDALAWQTEEPGDVMALIALGEAVEARGQIALAARAYASIIDLFPSRADLRRMAAQRLERLGAAGDQLAADSLAKAAVQRPDHLTGHRQLAYALVRNRRLADAFAAIEAGLAARYPADRFPGGARILREDLGIIGAAWIARQPAVRADVQRRLRAAGATLATTPSTRFVLSWETDANDVDFHIYDARGNHAYYQDMKLASGGELYQDVTNGYGPECFAINGPTGAAPYRLRIHYYSRGPMGYGMGELEILRHDGKGGIELENRPFVVMNDEAYVELGTVK